LGYVLTAVVLIFTTVALVVFTYLTQVFMEYRGLVDVITDNYGNIIRRPANFGIAVAIILGLFVVAFRIVRYLFEKNWSNTTDANQLKILQDVIELTTETSAGKLKIQNYQVDAFLTGDVLFAKGYAHIELLLKDMLSNLTKRLYNLLRGYNKDLKHNDISITIAFLFDPPGEPENHCSDSTKDKWMWICYKGIMPPAVASAIAGAPDDDGRQSTMRKALRNCAPLCFISKADAYERKE